MACCTLEPGVGGWPGQQSKILLLKNENKNKNKKIKILVPEEK